MQVVDAPEILTVIESVPHLSTFLNALYECRYDDFFRVSRGPAWELGAACASCPFHAARLILRCFHRGVPLLKWSQSAVCAPAFVYATCILSAHRADY